MVPNANFLGSDWAFTGARRKNARVTPDHRAGRGGFELGTDGPRAILVGVDGSPTSLRAAAYAAGLARRQHTKLVIVYASTAPGGMLSTLDFTGASTRLLRETQHDMKAQLTAAVEAWEHSGTVHAQVVVREGSPLRVLREVAEEVHAEAVIVGSSAGFCHRIIGSLAIRLVRTRRWPVTVVP
jgi:nucleotide-binding universal stress UspA family protein